MEQIVDSQDFIGQRRPSSPTPRAVTEFCMPNYSDVPQVRPVVVSRNNFYAQSPVRPLSVIQPQPPVTDYHQDSQFHSHSQSPRPSSSQLRHRPSTALALQSASAPNLINMNGIYYKKMLNDGDSHRGDMEKWYANANNSFNNDMSYFPSIRSPSPRLPPGQTTLSKRNVPRPTYSADLSKSYPPPVYISQRSRTMPVKVPGYRHGRQGSGWRHIQSTTTNDGKFITLVDGTVRIEDNTRRPIGGGTAKMISTNFCPTNHFNRNVQTNARFWSEQYRPYYKQACQCIH